MDFNHYVTDCSKKGKLVVQPRMGFSDYNLMREGLMRVMNANACTVGTITLDSYTRVNDLDSAQKALDAGLALNGFPIINYGPNKTAELTQDLLNSGFPIQVRHGSSLPVHIFECLIESGLIATEGGPISYCLPYSRTPLSEAVEAWRKSAILSANAPNQVHIESFGGCMLGQMCPPSLLLALDILECMFFEQCGLDTMSLSYAQQTSLQQDIAAVKALRQLGNKYLKCKNWHIVAYTYMGVYPKSETGALRLLKDSVELCYYGGAERLIVKTIVESQRIPTIDENILSLETASSHWDLLSKRHDNVDIYDQQSLDLIHEIASEASVLIDAVLDLNADIGQALTHAFSLGLLDVPYCLHQSNANKARAYIASNGMLQWQSVGNMPIKSALSFDDDSKFDPFAFLEMLSTVEKKYDAILIEEQTAQIK